MSEEKIKILVVDDEESVCLGVKTILEPAGYEVNHAITGEEALAIIKKKDFDIVLLDLVMPGVDGAEVCERIKKLKPKTKVVGITGSPTGNRLIKFITSGGIDACLYKPFGKEEILSAIKKVKNGDYVKFRSDT